MTSDGSDDRQICHDDAAYVLGALSSAERREYEDHVDGCPRCGYAYQREGGYFLIATWGVHYFTVTGVCLAMALLVDHFFPTMSFTRLAVVVAIPTVLFGFWFARYAKSLYLAIDHYFDPHVKPPAPDAPQP